MKPLSALPSLVLLLACGTLPMAAAGTLVDDDFSRGRDGWFNTNRTLSGGVDVEDGRLRIRDGVCVVRQFPEIAMQPGQQLVITFDLVVKDPLGQPGSLRFGLFHCNGAPLWAADGPIPDMENCTGYMLRMNPLPSADSFMTFTRRIPNPGNRTLMSSTTQGVNVTASLAAAECSIRPPPASCAPARLIRLP